MNAINGWRVVWIICSVAGALVLGHMAPCADAMEYELVINNDVTNCIPIQETSQLQEPVNTNDATGAMFDPIVPVSESIACEEKSALRTTASREHIGVRTTLWSDGARTSTHASRYTELACGLNYRDAAGQWLETMIEPSYQPDGSVVFSEMANPYRFAADAKSEVVVSREQGGGAVRSAVAALAYEDKSTGARVLVAVVQNSTIRTFDQGVFFTNAFMGLDADIVYRVHPWGLEQDIVLFGDLPKPSALGLSDESTVLCVLTELVGADIESIQVERSDGIQSDAASPEALRIVDVSSTEAPTLLYNFQRCYAFEQDHSLDVGGQAEGQGRQEVLLRLVGSGNRLFLFEEVPLAGLVRESGYLFADLDQGVLEAMVQREDIPVRMEASRKVPVRQALHKGQHLLDSASYVPRSSPRYVIDYIDYSSTITNDLVFHSGRMYLISSELVFSGAKLTIEPGCWIKFTSNAQIRIQSGSTVETKCHALDPAVLTSVYDTNSGGEAISGYVGNPSTNHYLAGLYFETGTNEVKGLDIRYANHGLRINVAGGVLDVQDCVFHSAKSDAVFSESCATTLIRNCLFLDSGTGVRCQDACVEIENCTFLQLTNGILAESSAQRVEIRDSLFSSLVTVFASNTSIEATFDHNARYESTNGWAGDDAIVLTNSPFESGAYGTNYLAQACPLINTGSTDAVTAGLYHYTTATNHAKELNSAVDIGWHYPSPLDTDSDGVYDYVEDANGDGTYSNTQDVSNWVDSDTDDDGLHDGRELYTYGTDPLDDDSDGDGQSDGLEVISGSDPTSTNSYLTTLSGEVAYAGTMPGVIRISAETLPPTNGLVLYYPFANNCATFIEDLSGVEQTGVVYNAAYVTNGAGGWYRFDGNEDYIRVTNNSFLQATNFSVSFWACSFDNPEQTGARGLIGKHKAYDNPNSYWLFQEYGNLRAQMWGDADTGSISFDMDFMGDRWGHVAATYDGASWMLYCNGQSIGTQAVASYQGNALDLLVGAGQYEPTPNRWWKGFMDEVMVYDRALSGMEVTNIYGLGNNFYLGRETTTSMPGNYTVANLPNVRDYFVWAYRDSNTNGIRDSWEAFGRYADNPVSLSSAASGVDLVLTEPDGDADGHSDWAEMCAGTNPDDPDSFPATISGEVAYSGSQTGTVFVTARTETGLVMYLSFDTDGGTNAIDQSGYGNHGVVHSASYFTNGYMGGAYHFDGTGDYIRVANSSSINATSFTICAWVQTWDGTYAEPARGVFGRHASGVNPHSWWVFQENDKLRAQLWGTSASPANNVTNISGCLNQWAHIAASYDGTSWTLYTNGHFCLKGTAAGYSENALDLLIGAGQYEGGAPARWWQGLIDEVKLYDRALASNEVMALVTDGWAKLAGYSTNMPSPGVYTISNVPNQKYYFVTAYRDSDGNGTKDINEPFGSYAENPLWLTNSEVDVDIVLLDEPDSDADGIPDWWEVLYGMNPLSGISDELVCWWTFDEGGGTNIQNSSSTQYIGQARNMSESNWVSGVLSNALAFDGVDDYVGVPQDPVIITSQVFTLSAWVYVDSSGEDIYGTVFSDWASSQGYWIGNYTYNNQFEFYVNYSAAAAMTNQCGYYNRWTHFVGVYDGTTAVLYADGVAVDSITTPLTAANQTELYLGGGKAGEYLKGKLDDLRIYRSALSSNSVNTMYDVFQDPDGDGLNNLAEYQTKTNPFDDDTDGDGMPDGWEVQNLLSPVDDTGSNGSNGDPDNDGLVNINEYVSGTHANDHDTDDDGAQDGYDPAPLIDSSLEVFTVSYPTNGLFIQ